MRNSYVQISYTEGIALPCATIREEGTGKRIAKYNRITYASCFRLGRLSNSRFKVSAVLGKCPSIFFKRITPR
jgi:hypothetical protein